MYVGCNCLFSRFSQDESVILTISDTSDSGDAAPHVAEVSAFSFSLSIAVRRITESGTISQNGRCSD